MNRTGIFLVIFMISFLWVNDLRAYTFDVYQPVCMCPSLTEGDSCGGFIIPLGEKCPCGGTCDEQVDVVYLASFGVNLDKKEYNPKETIKASGRGYSRSCSNSSQYITLEAEINDTTKVFFRKVSEGGKWSKWYYKNFIAENVPGEYEALFKAFAGFSASYTIPYKVIGNENIEPPKAIITKPNQGQVFKGGDLIEFVGRGEGGESTVNYLYQWYADWADETKDAASCKESVNGGIVCEGSPISNQRDFSRNNISAGKHTAYFRVKDANEWSKFDSVTFEVEKTPLPQETCELKVTIKGQGSVTGDKINCISGSGTCDYTYKRETKNIKLVESSSFPWTFLNWSGSCSGQSSFCSIDCNSAQKKVTATFDKPAETCSCDDESAQEQAKDICLGGTFSYCSLKCPGSKNCSGKWKEVRP